MKQAKKRVAIVAAEFNKPLVNAMIEAAQNELRAANTELVGVFRVAGAYEIPIVADSVLAQKAVDALVVLGYIERGETLHGEVMGHVVHAALVQIQLKHRKPVGLGIIGPGATADQADLRKVGYATNAVRAMLQNCVCLAEIETQ